MRIAVWHDLPSGGGKRALYQHVQGLVYRGHFVESWCLDTAAQTYLPLSQLVTEHVCPLYINGNQNISDAERETALTEAYDDASRRCAAEIEDGGFDLLFANTAQRFHVPYVLKYVQIQKFCTYRSRAGPYMKPGQSSRGSLPIRNGWRSCAPEQKDRKSTRLNSSHIP